MISVYPDVSEISDSMKIQIVIEDISNRAILCAAAGVVLVVAIIFICVTKMPLG